MLSIGFAELLIIAVITLLVVGPERLPESIRFFSVSLSKFRRYWRGAKRDIEKELGIDDIRREIHNAEVMERLQQSKDALNENLLKDPEQKKTSEVPLSESSSGSVEQVEKSLDSQIADLENSTENSILPPDSNPSEGTSEDTATEKKA